MIMREKKNTTMRKKIGDMRKNIKFCKKSDGNNDERYMDR